ncbi:hypothetical protein [Microcoleus vaginatus]|uniref:hypothetical protein n=1 Tax=Microcoleus vaginatus TaxID=119532 RepID=UPI001F607A7F|nr:hypothetical protein D0A37_16935 [Microcoleus vaginatus HSN003]
MNNTQLTGKLANPKLMLFAFHLCSNLAKGDKQSVEADHLWHKCVALGQLLQTEPKLDFLPENLSNRNSQNNEQSEYVELWQSNVERLVSFTTVSQPDQLPLKGVIYPLRLHDTYALDFTLLFRNSTVEVKQLSSLNFQGCLLPCEIEASLGQTLVLFAKPVDFAGNHQDLAVDCVEALFQDSELKQPKPYLVGDGKLLGSPIFEFDNSQEDPRLKCHILVWLDTNEKTLKWEEDGYYYRPLINLLCCRSKIIYAYHQAYRCNEEARKIYRQLEEKVEEFSRLKSDREERLEQLEGCLTELPQIGLNYARYLRDIEFHQTTIETNVANYSYWLKQLGDCSVQEMDNLDFIQKFVDRSCPIFQKQIKVNMSYLTVGRQLFQQMIETIRGIVEVDAQKQQVQYEKVEKERDRNLQNTIQAVGTGIGVGVGFAGIVAAGYPLIIEKPWDFPSPQHPLLPPHPFIIALLLSCLSGGGLGWLAWFFTKRHLKAKSSPQQTISPSPQNQLPFGDV